MRRPAAAQKKRKAAAAGKAPAAAALEFRFNVVLRAPYGKELDSPMARTVALRERYSNVALRAPYGKELDSRLAGSRLLAGFEQRRHALAAADAHRDDAVLAAATAELVQQVARHA